ASALAIVEESGKEFAIRVTPEKQATLEAAAAPGGATSPRMVLEAAQAFAEDLRTKEEFPAAAEALKVAKTAATRLGNQSLTKAVLEREKELAIQRAEFDKSQAALKILESRPDDPAANLNAGRYLCFYRGDWEAGLTQLAKGNDSNLAGLAKRDLVQPS